MTSRCNFDQVINRYGTYCTQWDYVQDRFGQAGLIPFTISDMDFASPEPVLRALKERLEHPVLGYSRWNHSDFKKAIKHWYHTRFDADMPLESLVYGPSVIYIIAKLIEQWTMPGDGVVIQTPAYDAFEKMIRGANRRVVDNPLIKKNGRFHIDWHRLEQQLANPKTRLLLLCSPHNPTGRVWRPDELEKIAVLCDKHKVRVISDEIHMDVTFTHHTPWQGFGIVQPWALVTSASKSFNTPALNGAYAFLPDLKSRDEYLFKLKQVDGLSSPSILGVIGMMAAYHHGEEWLNSLTEYVADNHLYVRETLKTAFPQLDYTVPEATYLAWIDLNPLSLDMTLLNQTLINDYQVAIMQGEVYGESGKGYVRLNLGCPRSKVEMGVQALIGAIHQQR